MPREEKKLEPAMMPSMNMGATPNPDFDNVLGDTNLRKDLIQPTPHTVRPQFSPRASPRATIISSPSNSAKP